MRMIVDGYNVLHAHPGYAALAADDLDAARARLVSDLAGFAQGGDRLVVVFDGGGNPGSDGAPHHIGSLTVIFSPAGSDADSVVEALAARSRERGEAAVVVTSDVATRHAVRSGVVSVMSAEAFIADLAAATAEHDRLIAERETRGVVKGRIDPGVSEILARWARGDAPETTSAR